MKCLPRPEPHTLAGKIAKKEAWDFYKSVFKDYRPDTDALLRDCFEIDWALTKCPKLIKSDTEREAVKALLGAFYPSVRECYKYYSSLSPIARVAAIGSGVLTELCRECPGLLDGTHLKLTDLDLSIIACNGGGVPKD